MKLRLSTHSQRGDTIVEVLICVLIVSVILGGAYTTTRQSANGVRNSQEHAEGLKLIQSQVEQLRTGATKAPPNIFTTPAPPAALCMVNGAPIVATNPGCQQNRSVEAASAEDLAYRLSIKRSPCAVPPTPAIPNCTKFEIRADWDGVTGTPAQETIFYRLYQ